MQAGCALVGGETAEHPGVMRPDEYDVSRHRRRRGRTPTRMLGPDRVRPGDVLIALGSSGLHSNGYSLVRHVLLEQAGLALDSTPDGSAGGCSATICSRPTRIYAQDCLALAAQAGAHAFAHITGGGLAGNLVRVLPPTVDAVVDRSTWAPQPIFGLVASTGAVSREQTGADVQPRCRDDRRRGRPTEPVTRWSWPRRATFAAWQIGEIRAGSGTVAVTGDYQGAAADWR